MSGQQISNAKYRNWVKAGLGLKYVKEGMEPFCDDIVKQQHVHILNNVKQKHNLTIVNCGLCSLKTLKPDHVRTRYKQCPLGQKDCNCQYPGGKFLCPNNVCGAIYDEIIKLHASTPAAPYWRNTDVQLWCTEPWAVATCFINAPGYTQKLTASEIDCPGLLHLLINNKHLQTHINCKITGTDAFSMVRQHRNTIFHCENMELEDTDVDTYIDDMIDALQDNKELNHRNESKAAVKELLQLKRHDFIITTSLEAEVKAARTSFKDLQDELKRKLKAEIEQKGSDVKAELVQKGSDIKADMDQEGSDIRTEMEQKGLDIKTEMDQRGSDIKAKLEQIGLDIRAEVEHKGSNIKAEVGMKGSDVKAEIGQRVSDIRAEVLNFKVDIEQKGSEIKAGIGQKGSDINADVDQKGLDIKTELEQKGSNVRAQMEQKGSDIRVEVEQKGSDIKTEIKQIGSDIKNDLEKKGNDLQIKLQESFCHCTESDQQRRYANMKKELKTKLVDMYQEVTKTSSLPLLADEDLTDIVEVYVPPLMTIQIDSQSKADEKQLIQIEGGYRKAHTLPRDIKIHMHDIFHKEGKPVKLIYVLGEAGSGKSAFCKYLVSQWCAAHSDKKCRKTDIGLVNEMRKFDFLFYISLRHFSDCHSIRTMLNEAYPDPVLDRLLQIESESCLIVLDGLDEWTPIRQNSSMFQAKGLPERDISKNYTVVTTSRLWKFTSLRIKKSEIGQTIRLEGIDDNSVERLARNTLRELNKTFEKKKCISDFRRYITESPASEICHVPMILQQLVCLWFDDKLNDTSKCAVNSSMIELFFEWSAQKEFACKAEKEENDKEMSDVYLPEYLNDYVTCCENEHLINCLSYLAYETLFDESNNNSLTFTGAKLQQLKMPDHVKKYSLRTGILSEDRCVTLLASRRQPSSFSFIHKSIQEFLASVFIAIQFENITRASAAADSNHDIGKECFLKYCGVCKSVDDILEQSSVISMLCGLVPQLARCISEIIYNIVAEDKRVNEYRKTLYFAVGNSSTDTKLFASIQSCIISCLKEVISRQKPVKSCMYLGDIIINDSSQLSEMSLALENQVIISESVRSLDLNILCNDSALKYLIKCKRLQAFRYVSDCSFETTTEMNNVAINEILVSNISTLECVALHVYKEYRTVVGMLLKCLPSMHQLISLHIGGIIFPCNLSYEMYCSWSTLLTELTRLQEISIYCKCDQGEKHGVNLSNHRQLQCVNLRMNSYDLTQVHTDKLVTCSLHISNAIQMILICDSLHNAYNVTHLGLDFPFIPRVDDVPEWKTESLIRLLPSLPSLRSLTLTCVNFTDNIITSPAEMKNLERIVLDDFTMSMTTWCKFIDSVGDLPHNVYVKTGGMEIRPDTVVHEIDPWDSVCTRKEALRYVHVREKTMLRVTFDSQYENDMFSGLFI